MLLTRFMKITGTTIAVLIQEQLVLEEIPQFGVYLVIPQQNISMLQWVIFQIGVGLIQNMFLITKQAWLHSTNGIQAMIANQLSFLWNQQLSVAICFS